MNLFGTLNTATTGMGAAQISLQTAGNNIANSNDPFYSRQRVDLETLPSLRMTGTGFIGMGVRAAGVERISNVFVQNQLNTVNGAYNSYSEQASVLTQLGGYYNEPSDTGLLSQIDSLNSDWTSLANNPSSTANKTTVIGGAINVTNTINQIANNMTGLQSNTVQTISKGALDFNQTISQLNALNHQIYNLAQGAGNGVNQQPNSLLDQRDQLIQKLAGSANINTSFDQYGQVTVTVGDGKTDILDPSKGGIQGVLGTVNASGTGVLSDNDTANMQGEYAGMSVPTGAKAGDLVFVANNADGTPGSTATTMTVSSGTINGDQNALTAINSQLDSLNKFAFQLAATTNTLMTQAGATNTLYSFNGGITGDQAKTYTPGVNYAANISVNQTLANDPSKLQSGISNDGAPVASGDGTLAQSIANLQNEQLADPSTGTLGPATKNPDGTLAFATTATGSTVSGMFNNIVTQNGIVTQATNSNAATQLSLLQQAQAKQQSISGVDMNEEMSNVIKFQQGFQANAKMISVINEMLETLINRTGVN